MKLSTIKPGTRVKFKCKMYVGFADDVMDCQIAHEYWMDYKKYNYVKDYEVDEVTEAISSEEVTFEMDAILDDSREGVIKGNVKDYCKPDLSLDFLNYFVWLYFTKQVEFEHFEIDQPWFENDTADFEAICKHFDAEATETEDGLESKLSDSVLLFLRRDGKVYFPDESNLELYIKLEKKYKKIKLDSLEQAISLVESVQPFDQLCFF